MWKLLLQAIGGIVGTYLGWLVFIVFWLFLYGRWWCADNLPDDYAWCLLNLAPDVKFKFPFAFTNPPPHVWFTVITGFTAALGVRLLSRLVKAKGDFYMSVGFGVVYLSSLAMLGSYDIPVLTAHLGSLATGIAATVGYHSLHFIEWVEQRFRRQI